MYKEKKIIAINYADAPYREAQKYNTKTAYKVGKVDQVIEYGPDQIDSAFREKHQKAFVMNNPKSGRWGLWRPHILMHTINKIDMGDYLIYCDSGAYYLKPVSYLLDAMEKAGTDFMPFDLYLPERMYCKRDIFVEMGMDEDIYVNTNQRLSTFIVLKKTEKTVALLKEYLRLAIESSFIFTDEDNRLGLPNYPDYRDTRHNQSVISLLSKKFGYPSFRDPSQYGGFFISTPPKDVMELDDIHRRSEYPTVFMHHRRKEITLRVKLHFYKRIIKETSKWKYWMGEKK